MKLKVENLEMGYAKKILRLRRGWLAGLALAALGLAGCNPAAKVSLVEARVPKLHGLSQLNGTARVANAGAQPITVESATVVVRYRGDRTIGHARLLLPVVVAARDTTAIRYDFALEELTLSGLQTLSTRALTTPDAFTVDVSGYVRRGGIRKKIDLKGVPLTQFLRNFGP